MHSKRLSLVAVLLLAACTSHAAAQQCTDTFFSAASQDPSLGLLTTAVSSLSPSDSSIIPSPASNITIFAPNDDAFLALFQSQGLTLASVSELTTKLTSVLLQHVLLNATTEAQLSAGGEFPSALGQLLNQSYPVTANVTSGGNVTVAARANTTPANLLRTIPVCTSLVYVVDKVLLPASNISSVPSLSLAAVQAAASGAGLSDNATATAPAGSPAVVPDRSPSAAAAAAPATQPPPPPPNSATAAAAAAALLPALLLAAAVAGL